MDQMQFLVLSQMRATEPERSRAAHRRHLRAEQARQVRDAQPSALSLVARAWAAVVGSPRASVETGAAVTHS